MPELANERFRCSVSARHPHEADEEPAARVTPVDADIDGQCDPEPKRETNGRGVGSSGAERD